MPHSILAIDIDLGRCTMVDSWAGVVCHGVHPFVLAAHPRLSPATVLIEVAGPIMHHADSHSHRRWLLYNIATAVTLAQRFSFANVLVCSSTTWTKGYTEPARHAIAGINPLKHKLVKGERVAIYAEPHDVRECRAMIDFYHKAPKSWVPLPVYLESLI